MKSALLQNVIVSGVAIQFAALSGCEGTGSRESRYLYEAPPTAQAPAPKHEPTGLAVVAEPMPEERPVHARSNWWPTVRGDASANWTAMAFPTGDATTSVLGVEQGYPKEARLNQEFAYKVLVTNLTRNTLENVILAEDFGQNLKYVSSMPSASANGSRATWMLGTFKPEETKPVLVRVTPLAEGTVGSCASVTYATSLCTNVAVVSPKLQITMSGPAEVTRCDEIVYMVEVLNPGTGTLSGVRVDEALPRGMETIDGETSVSIDVGTLGAGQSKQFPIRAKASAKGTYEAKATATGESDLKAESGVVATIVREPALKVTRIAPAESYTNVPFTVEFTVTNTGDAPAVNTVLEDKMPAGVAVMAASDRGSATSGKVTWNLGTLAPGASKKASLTMRGDAAGTVRNVVTATATCAETVTDSADVALRGIPATLLEVVDLSDPIKIGDNVTYRITVTNQGSAEDRDIKVLCTLEDNQQFVSATGATAGTASGKTIILAPLAILAPKAQAVWSVTVKNVKAGDVRFSVSLTSHNLTRNVEETEATTVWE